MDSFRASRMEEEFQGKPIGGWTIQRLLGAGKSAAVFEATRGNQKSALKIFDNELVEKFGRTTQIGRINRELELVGQSHPNLVRILGGGQCKESGNLYVAMEYVDSPNLASVLDVIPSEKIGPLIKQVASAARRLEQLELVHRDIKPDNIVVSSDFSRAVLLDLGVLRPFGDSDLTDDEAKVFIGTLRYSSPEFLWRKEGHTPEGWRAITFYQLGAVIHDLVMKQPLFHEFSDPYAMLVEAVKHETPNIHSDSVSPDLVVLAQNCLIKDPDARLKLVSWDDFNRQFSEHRWNDGAMERVRQRALRPDLENLNPARQVSAEQVSAQFNSRIEDIVRLKCLGKREFPRIALNAGTFETKAYFTVLFAASISHSLARALQVRFECEVINPPTQTVFITATAHILEGDNPMIIAPTHEEATVFRGPLDSVRVSENVVITLYSAMDLAQRHLIDSSQITTPICLDLAPVLEGLL